jgi:hypothetical protein
MSEDENEDEDLGRVSDLDFYADFYGDFGGDFGGDFDRCTPPETSIDILNLI